MATKTWSYDTENGVAIIDSPTTQYLVDNSSTVTIPSHYVRGNTSYISGSRSRYYEIQYGLYNGSDTNRFGDAVRVRTNTVANSSTNATVPASTISGISIWSLFNQDNPTTRIVPVSIRHEGGQIYTGGDIYLWSSSDSSWTGVIIGTINCVLNAPPTLTTGELTFDTPYIYTGLTTASVRVSGLSAKYGGNVTEVKFTIGNQSVTRSGSSSATMSILLEAEGTFTPTVTVTDSRGQTTTKTLPAITVEGYTAPSAVLQAERTTATGVDDDEGEYAVLDTTFTFTDLVADLTAPTVTIDGTPATVTWYSSRATDGTLSGTVNWSSLTSPATVYGLIDVPNIQTSYSVSITPNDTKGSGTPITQTVASAFYTIDFLAGGHGIAFGQPSSQEGFYCNMDAHFKDKANLVRALFDFIHPVGSYYETSDTSFNPNATWGGTWVLETEGQVHISAGANYAVNGALTNATDGGSSTVTLDTTQMPAHTHGQKTLTGTFNVRSGPSNTYTINGTSGIASVSRTTWSGSHNVLESHSASNPLIEGTTINATHEHSSVGGGQPHDNMQPYIIVNRWHRTA